MAGFVQIIEWKSTRIDEIRALQDEYRGSQADVDGGPLSITVTADRDRPDTYLTLVHFADYDAAMANSARPETSEFAQKMGALCDGPPSFFNLDVVEEIDLG
jgi:hypothetical protein